MIPFVDTSKINLKFKLNLFDFVNLEMQIQNLYTCSLFFAVCNNLNYDVSFERSKTYKSTNVQYSVNKPPFKNLNVAVELSKIFLPQKILYKTV